MEKNNKLSIIYKKKLKQKENQLTIFFIALIPGKKKKKIPILSL